MPPRIPHLLEVTENYAVTKCGLPLWRGQLSAFDTLYLWTYCCSRDFSLTMPLSTVPVSGMVLGVKNLVEFE